MDIKLADFGLSHLVNPHERMHMACGTLSYVGTRWVVMTIAGCRGCVLRCRCISCVLYAAPEVLTMKGYGFEADLWSVGVILHLVYVQCPHSGESGFALTPVCSRPCRVVSLMLTVGVRGLRVSAY